MVWRLLNTGSASADRNMALDAELLRNLSSSSDCILHLYAWDGACATYGHFIRPYDYLDLRGVEKMQLQLARRPTGGGIIFHLCDLAFSILVPSTHPAYSKNTLENYAFINAIVSKVVTRFLGGEKIPVLLPEETGGVLLPDPACRHFCMAKPTKYDVMLDGRKVGGGAQRCTKQGFLHQGSIAVAAASELFLGEVLKSGKDVVEAMRSSTYPLLPGEAALNQLEEARYTLRELLAAECMRCC